MELREVVFENLIGDLDYHPKCSILYLGLGVGHFAFGSSRHQMTSSPRFRWYLAVAAQRFCWRAYFFCARHPPVLYFPRKVSGFHTRNPFSSLARSFAAHFRRFRSWPPRLFRTSVRVLSFSDRFSISATISKIHGKAYRLFRYF